MLFLQTSSIEHSYFFCKWIHAIFPCENIWSKFFGITVVSQNSSGKNIWLEYIFMETVATNQDLYWGAINRDMLLTEMCYCPRLYGSLNQLSQTENTKSLLSYNIYILWVLNAFLRRWWVNDYFIAAFLLTRLNLMTIKFYTQEPILGSRLLKVEH